MTRAQFEALPLRDHWTKEIECDNIIILPSRRMHDSGFRCLDFVAVTETDMIRLSGCSDVVHVEGIGGFGYQWLERFKKVPTSVHPVGWCFDCLKVSGLLRLFAHGYRIKCGPALSSFEIFSIPTERELQRRKEFEGPKAVFEDATTGI